MNPFDFRSLAPGPVALPYQNGNDFLFWYAPPAPVNSAAIDPGGVNCGTKSIIDLYASANAVDLDVINSASATISSWSLGPAGFQQNIPQLIISHKPGQVQHIRFDHWNIRRIVLESSGELILQSIR
jgi:hypothetical protein